MLQEKKAFDCAVATTPTKDEVSPRPWQLTAIYRRRKTVRRDIYGIHHMSSFVFWRGHRLHMDAALQPQAASTAVQSTLALGPSCCAPAVRAHPHSQHNKAAMFPEMMCKAGWNKEHTIDALYRKAGYRGKRPRNVTNTPPSDATPTDTDTSGSNAHDSVVSRTAVFLRFETVSFRMGFCKYQRAKAAAHESARSQK